MPEDRAPKRPNFKKFHQPIYSAEHKKLQREQRKASEVRTITRTPEEQERIDAPFGRCPHGYAYKAKNGLPFPEAVHAWYDGTRWCEKVS